jgi:hypothetical protein
MEDEGNRNCSGDQLVTPDNGEGDSLENIGMFFLIENADYTNNFGFNLYNSLGLYHGENLACDLLGHDAVQSCR